jgi:hypothetical protein
MGSAGKALSPESDFIAELVVLHINNPSFPGEEGSTLEDNLL